MISTENFLRNVLRANAVFSIVSAIIASAAAVPLASSLAVPVGELYHLAANLGVFAAFLLFLAARPILQRTWVSRSILFVAVADVLWVLGTIVGLVTGLGEATGLGRALVVLVGLIVGVFGALELRGWQALRRETASPEAPESTAGVL